MKVLGLPGMGKWNTHTLFASCKYNQRSPYYELYKAESWKKRGDQLGT